MSDIIIVSNRLPISVKKTPTGLEFSPSIGGLATGLSSYATQRGHKWIGWPGIASEDLSKKEKQHIIDELEKSNCYPVFLTRKQLNDFYNVFSNSILWPLFHNLPVEPANYTEYWRSYETVNLLFKDVVIALSKPGSTIWVHDYQLMLLPGMLRQQRPYDAIGFFLHIPFPDAQTFLSLRYGKKLLDGLLGASLIGFHTKSYVRHFLDACQTATSAIISGSSVSYLNHLIQVADFPMGIDYEKYTIAQNTKTVRLEAKILRQKYGRKKVILTVDRLDPTKGLLERLEAYKQLLETQPKLHRKVVLVMLAVPSRTDIAAYQDLRSKLESLVKEINTKYGTLIWKPVDYIYGSLSFDKLTALYQIADIAFITPLRDGMNLVAKEYLASQKYKNGVLILSKTAGAAEELTHALLVDPEERPSMVQALHKAIIMPSKELKNRVDTMQKYLSQHTVHDWAGTFMGTLQKSHRLMQPYTSRLIGKSEDELIRNYQTAQKRQLFLDYDGVLMPFFNMPDEARPSKALLKLLGNLAADKKNEVIVISGRKQADLDNWLGSLDISLVSEHGAAMRKHQGTWQQFGMEADNWKKLLRPLLIDYALKTPGAFIEDKNHSLVWHYRMSPPYYAQKNLVLLKKVLRGKLRTSQLEFHGGHKIIEIKSKYAKKSLAARDLLDKHADFIIAIGDDYTDEDMFSVLPANSYTIKVGPGRSRAKFRLDSPASVLKLLSKFLT
ncbi:bifunctional alpha,alpha-trehalose-phosphate synthase (UDP-forming)/trehalose-phosphatase [Candidatus Saccharibacteria bacterium]|nr:bifunctional alpha,alpha-trehalose-phosphate synthase (UDP-forming)/trehalose-phosphatase [Candidatus Saccharibacteria bacterium]